MKPMSKKTIKIIVGIICVLLLIFCFIYKQYFALPIIAFIGISIIHRLEFWLSDARSENK